MGSTDTVAPGNAGVVRDGRMVPYNGMPSMLLPGAKWGWGLVPGEVLEASRAP